MASCRFRSWRATAGTLRSQSVSNHILTPERRLDQGFDIYDFADDARDATATTDAVLRRLDRYRTQDALFLWVHYIDPHVPYYPPREIALRFDPAYQGAYGAHFGDRKGGIGDQAYPSELGKVKAVYQNDLAPEVNAHVRRLYAADIRNTDDEIGRLVGELRRRFGDDWSILFTADHGESLGENDYYFDHGEYVSNAEIRVPLNLVLPSRDPLHGRRTIDEWVSLVDVMPTLVELLDLSMPKSLGYRVDGRSLLGYLTRGSLPERPVFAESGELSSPSGPAAPLRRVRTDTHRAAGQAEAHLDTRAPRGPRVRHARSPSRSAGDGGHLSSEPRTVRALEGSLAQVGRPRRGCLQRYQ